MALVSSLVFRFDHVISILSLLLYRLVVVECMCVILTHARANDPTNACAKSEHVHGCPSAMSHAEGRGADGKYARLSILWLARCTDGMIMSMYVQTRRNARSQMALPSRSLV